MINRLNSAKRKDHKLKIEKLIKKQIDNPKNMYKRSCVKEGELVFKKILKKEIDNKRFRDYEEQLHNRFKSNHIEPFYNDWNSSNIYTTNWSTITDLIRSTIDAFNCLGKKYTISNKLARDIRYNFLLDTNNLQYYISYRTQVSEVANKLGKYLLEIDDIFAVVVLDIAFGLDQPLLLKLALDKLYEYEISSDAIRIIREMKGIVDIFARFLQGVYEFNSMEKFWKIILLYFENKTQAVNHLSMTFDWEDISLEMKPFLLENGFSEP